MEVQEKPQIKKLKSLDDLEVGNRIIIKADKCPFSDKKVIVLKTKKGLRFVGSYFDLNGDLLFIESSKVFGSFGELRVGIYTPHGELRIDEEGRLLVDGYGLQQTSNDGSNSNGFELTTEMKNILSKTGYKIPEWVN